MDAFALRESGVLFAEFHLSFLPVLIRIARSFPATIVDPTLELSITASIDRGEVCLAPCHSKYRSRLGRQSAIPLRLNGLRCTPATCSRWSKVSQPNTLLWWTRTKAFTFVACSVLSADGRRAFLQSASFGRWPEPRNTCHRAAAPRLLGDNGRCGPASR